MNEDGLPWVEKYRPKKLNEVVGQGEITKRLESYVQKKSLPNLLFSGPAGIGKTSSAVSLANELYDKGFERNFLELNASDERGIDVVRKTIKDFARTMAFDTDFKIIFLDESDALTADAQQALRRTMEKFTKTCRFVLSCNYSSRLIEPLQSRCVIFRFKPLNSKDIENRLIEIAKIEGLELEKDSLKAITYVAQGDLRKAINVLQASSAVDSKIKSNTIFTVSSKAKPEEIKELIKLSLAKKFLEAREKLDVLLYEYGMSGEDLVLQLYRELIDMPEEELSGKTKIELLDKIGETNFRIVEGANERIQLEALIAQFMKYTK
ncbi:MAG: replication factor C small subunit [Candidatus Diapherotrites archaeon CG10_big_fil_rev_8_21_14_0_10_31_34]|nr:MAG: replication factor C small subunit [Candidatus Diapherotrites archaeon CG10_big_fil_rev_8_21_14_0_10_31_34]